MYPYYRGGPLIGAPCGRLEGEGAGAPDVEWSVGVQHAERPAERPPRELVEASLALARSSLDRTARQHPVLLMLGT